MRDRQREGDIEGLESYLLLDAMLKYLLSIKTRGRNGPISMSRAVDVLLRVFAWHSRPACVHVPAVPPSADEASLTNGAS